LEAIDKAQELQADLILMDIGLPSQPVRSCKRIRKIAPRMQILSASSTPLFTGRENFPPPRQKDLFPVGTACHAGSQSSN
jgi:CheY-like chemotaxis protein